MLTYQDCVGLCDLDETEIESIAEHEHIPEMIALELGNYIIHGDDGVPRIRRIIIDDIQAAEGRGDGEHARQLKTVLKHFVETHPHHPPPQA